MDSIKVLVIATSIQNIADSNYKAGIWLEELATPYYIFKAAGTSITMASPNGGLVPVDPRSQSIIVSTTRTKRFLNDVEAMDFLSHSIILKDVKDDDFDVAYLPGGHGPMWDLADNKILKQLLERFYNAGKPIGAVCHGVVGLLSLQNDNGEFLVKGKNLTGFSNTEEASTGLAHVLPFLLESRLAAIGALYTKGEDYLSYMVTDGNIVTGQNPDSSGQVAKKIMELAENRKEASSQYKGSLIK